MRRLVIVLALSAGCGRVLWGEDTAVVAQRAVEAERRGDFPAAISGFQELIRSGADSPDLRSNLGIAYFQTRRYADALEQFRIALRSEPGFVPANLFAGLSLLKLDRSKEALHYLEQANQLRPSDPQISLALAQARLGANEVAQARDDYERATRLQPDSAEAWYGLGITDRVLAEAEAKPGKGQPVEKSRALLHDSEEAISKAVQLDPSSVQVHMLFGEALRIAERYPEAVHEYELATQQTPQLAAAWAGLATACSAAGDDAGALQAGRRALELDPADASTTALIAGTYLREGDPANGESYAKKALALDPRSTAAHVALAKIYLARHEVEKAVPELQAAAPDDADGSIHYLLGTSLRQLGRTREAAAAMQRYRELHASVLSR